MDTDKALNDAIMQVAQAKVAEALGGDVLGKIIQNVMDHKDRSYNGRRDGRTFFERMVQQEVERAVSEAIREHLKEQGNEIKLAVKTALLSNADKVATEVIDAFVGGDWRADLSIKLDRDD